MKPMLSIILNVILSALVLCLFTAIILLAVDKQNSSLHNSNVKQAAPATCENEDCQKLSASMFLLMNTSADPCDDFEEFACGNYRNLRFSPNEFISRISDYGKTLEAMKTEMLATDTEIKAESKNLQSLFNLTKSAFKICQDVYSPSSNSTQRFRQLESHIKDKFFSGTLPSTLEAFMVKIFSVAWPNFLSFDVESKSSSHLTFSVSISIDFARMTRFLKSFHENDLFPVWTQNSLYFLQKMKENMTFVDAFESDNSTCSFTSTELLGLVKSHNVSEATVLMNLLSIKNVTFILSQCNSTYSIVEFHRESPDLLISFLTMDIIRYNYYGLFTNVREEEIVEFCADVIAARFSPVVVEMFRQTYHPGKNWKEIRDLFTKVTVAAVSLIQKQDWLDNEAKTMLSDSLKSQRLTVGLHEGLSKATLDSLLTHNFTSVDVDSFQHVILFAYHTWTQASLQFMKDIDSLLAFISDITQQRWNVFEFNAFNIEKLIIHMPYGFFPSFVNSPGYPEYIKLGFFGSTSAHELGHNFLCTESLPGSEEKDKNFTEKCECVVKLYQRELMKFLSVNPSAALEISKLQLNENFPDVISDPISWRAAFEDSLEDGRMIDRLPGALSSFTPQQVFYVHKVQPLCSKFPFKRAKGYHSNNKLRVNMIAKNSNYFTKVFNCKAGAAMVIPESEKCFVL